MNNLQFADRLSDVPKSFIREILKVAISTDVISFAGGLPNRSLFPVNELQQASQMVFNQAASEAFQYSNSEGYLPLRQWIATRYKNTQGIDVHPENILITSGSQQGLDLLGKVFVNEGDEVIIEKPGYLGAIQLFSVYKSSFLPITLNNNGLDIDELKKVMKTCKPKLMYTVPNFQNPSGISYSANNRENVVDALQNTNTLIIEDNPYGELRFSGTEKPSFYTLDKSRTILLGSFSKITVPGFRLGWIVAPDYIMDKLLVAKQASDLHTNIFNQLVIYYYLNNFSLDAHVSKIKNVYGKQCQAMVNSIQQHFPKGVSFTRPEGGMFLWIGLPGKLSSMQLFDEAIRQKVAFVPGNPFYTSAPKQVNTLRLNFSCVDETEIQKGIKKLAKAIDKII